MDSQEIIKLFLNKGLQIDPKSLEFFLANKEKLEDFLKKMSGKKDELPSSITIDFVKKILCELEILQDFSVPQKTYTTENAIHFFNNRYETMKKFFIDNPSLENLISVNKITENTNKFSIIAMVKEKDSAEKTIFVEDQTGEILVSVEGKEFDDIVPDEIIGLVCEKSGNIPKASNVLFPDVPLKRDVNKTEDDVFCLFISDFHFESENFNKKYYENFLKWLGKFKYPNLHIFVLGGVSSDEKTVKEFFSKLPKDSVKIYLQDEKDTHFSADCNLSNPCLVKIDNVVMLLCSGGVLEYYVKLWSSLSVEKVMLNLLKKRHTDPVFSANKKIFSEDIFILKTLPDIFVASHFHMPGELNYKGTSILSLGSFTQQPTFWLTNLKTREIIKLDFT
jgi:DNA polymerase II small subunit/DNA polymerase delta subunit B